MGRAGERFVADQLQERDWFVLPAYDFTGAIDNKAPKLLGGSRNLVVPDILAFREGIGRWWEVKTYSHSVVFRSYNIEAHGIHFRHHQDYLAVEGATGHQVWIIICECSTKTTLFQRLRRLRTYPCMCRPCQANEERHCKMGRGGFVFFDRTQFRVAPWPWALILPPHRVGDGPLDDGSEQRMAEAALVEHSRQMTLKLAPSPDIGAAGPDVPF